MGAAAVDVAVFAFLRYLQQSKDETKIKKGLKLRDPYSESK